MKNPVIAHAVMELRTPAKNTPGGTAPGGRISRRRQDSGLTGEAGTVMIGRHTGFRLMSFYIQSVEIGGPRPFYLLGPCSLECESFVWEMARSIKSIAEKMDVPLIFKASYDKANRTSVTSFRGPGVKEGCRILAEIGKELNLPIVTDVHTAQEAEIASEYVDLLQIPAFLCRQTDLLEACAKSGRAVNIKKGQFLAPWDTVNIAEKMRAFGCDRFMMCERGTTFGYNNLVVDMRSLYWMKQEGFPVVFDATHAVQRPGGLGGTTGGDSELAPVLASAAMATGSVDGVFMEVHKDPSKALSDGPNQIPLHLLEGVLKRLQAIHQAVRSC